MPSASVKTAKSQQYDLYKNCYELDVVFTIDKDLDDESVEEKQKEMQQLSSYEQRSKEA